MIEKAKKKYTQLSAGVKASFWFFVCNVLQKSISVITVPIFTRILSTEEYGIYSSYTSWLNIFLIFTTFKLNYGVFNKGMTTYKEEKKTYVATMQSITSVFTLAFLFIYLILRSWFNSLTELPTYLMLLMIVEMFFNPAISFWSLEERYDLKYKKVVAFTLLMSVLNPIIGYAFVINSRQPAYARILSCILVDTIFGLIIYIYNYKETRVRYSRKIARFAILFNLPLIPHYMAEYVLDQSDRVMIQKMCSKTDLGLYSVNYNFAFAIKIVVSSLNSALIPWLYKTLDEGKKERISKVIIFSCLIIGLPICLFILIAPEIMYLLLPKSYYGAIYVIPPVSMSVFFVFLFGIYGNIEFFYNKNKFTTYVSMGSALLNIFLNYIGIKAFGYLAAAYTTLICYIVLNICHAVFMENIQEEGEGLLLNEKLIWTISSIFVLFSVMSTLLYKFTAIRWLIAVALFFIAFVKKNEIKRLIASLRK